MRMPRRAMTMGVGTIFGGAALSPSGHRQSQELRSLTRAFEGPLTTMVTASASPIASPVHWSSWTPPLPPALKKSTGRPGRASAGKMVPSSGTAGISRTAPRKNGWQTTKRVMTGRRCIWTPFSESFEMTAVEKSPVPCSAGILACGFWGLSSPQLRKCQDVPGRLRKTLTNTDLSFCLSL